MTQGEYAFGDFIDFQQQIVVQFFKFEVQLEKLFSLDIPMISAGILV